MKKMRVKRSLGVRAISRVEREAVIMERFTRSPHILDIYSHCGFTVLVEAMKSEIYDEIVPQEYIKQTELDKLQVEDVHPFNKLTVSEKLQIAIYMAESLADLHGHEGGLIVHGDVYIEQWLLAPDGSLKLNDFSDSLRAEWHEKKQKYCFDNEKSGSKTWRSPEEYEGSLQDDRSDVYIFGNCIYALVSHLLSCLLHVFEILYHLTITFLCLAFKLTGLLPFYNEAATFGEDDKVRVSALRVGRVNGTLLYDFLRKIVSNSVDVALFCFWIG
jgi:serine/threonine protein kinase